MANQGGHPDTRRPAGRSAEAFTRAYTRGITEQLPAPAPPGPDTPSRAGVIRDTRAGSRTGTRGLTAAAVAGDAFALHGAVITPDAAWDDGYVVVDNDTIAELTRTPPTGAAQVIDTDGVILPGLIDLHGHPEFNVFPAWEPPRQFTNRYQWRASDLYHQLVRDPQNQLLQNCRRAPSSATPRSAPWSAGSPPCKAPATPPAPREQCLKSVDDRGGAVPSR
jgi:hypothetical protein